MRHWIRRPRFPQCLGLVEASLFQVTRRQVGERRLSRSSMPSWVFRPDQKSRGLPKRLGALGLIKRGFTPSLASIGRSDGGVLRMETGWVVRGGCLFASGILCKRFLTNQRVQSEAGARNYYPIRASPSGSGSSLDDMSVQRMARWG